MKRAKKPGRRVRRRDPYWKYVVHIAHFEGRQ